ncbi:hypothetical protein BC835DRAFT_1310505 [Cytidiella melzeri]|nr:hypothetical protein BC835DRAFT_1310505 [Cytidiella melzeri]
MSGYDEHLLAAAPAATREQKQESYNIDLLKNSPSGASVQDDSNNAPTAPAAHDHEAESGFSTKERMDPYSARPVPWYRTKKWIVIFVILGVVVVAAVVGGAVGGTVGHKSHKNTPSTTSSNSTGGAGGVPDSGGNVPAASNSNVGGASPSSSSSASPSLSAQSGGLGGAGGSAAPTPSGSGGAIGASDFVIPTSLPGSVVGAL